MLVDDLLPALKAVSKPRARAILFALKHRISLNEVTLLTPVKALQLEAIYEEVMKRKPSYLPLNPLRGQPRHLYLNYCFWEFLTKSAESVACPLFGLANQVESLGFDFQELQERFKHLILIDNQADGEDCLAQLQLPALAP
jgi:hypothetical protein